MQGNGTLDVAAGNAEVNSFGIYTENGVTVLSGTVRIASGDAGGFSSGIFTDSGLTVLGGDVAVTAGEGSKAAAMRSLRRLPLSSPAAR